MMNDIICAIPTRLVAIFKDYLYFDDPTEYLRRWYTLRESTWRMPKIYTFLAEKQRELLGQATYPRPFIVGVKFQQVLSKNLKKKGKAWGNRVEELERIRRRKAKERKDEGVGLKGLENQLL